MTTTNDYSHLVTNEHRVLDMASNGGTPYDQLELSIEEHGTVSLDVRTYFGGDGTTFDVWHGRTRRFTLVGKGGAHIDLDALRDDLHPDGRLAPLITRIAAGLDSELDGSNMRGTLTDDAREAEDALEAIIYGIGRDWVDDTWATWDVGDWLNVCKGEISADMTDIQIKEWAAEAEEVATRDKVRLVGDALEWSTEVRAEKLAPALEAAQDAAEDVIIALDDDLAGDAVSHLLAPAKAAIWQAATIDAVAEALATYRALYVAALAG